MFKVSFPIAALMFAAWAVYLGGLAALQNTCNNAGNVNMPNVEGINDQLQCYQVYRLYWFYMAWEAALILALTIAGFLSYTNMSLIGLLAIATIFYIQAANTFLNAKNFALYYQSGAPYHRVQTVLAGAIMTAIMNIIAILALGHVQRPAAHNDNTYVGTTGNQGLAGPTGLTGPHHTHTHVTDKPVVTAV